MPYVLSIEKPIKETNLVHFCQICDTLMDCQPTIDLKTMSKRVESEQYYVTFEMFVADVKRMFANARTYNSPETIYYKCSTRHGIVLYSLFKSFPFIFLFCFSLNPHYSDYGRLFAGWNPIFKAKFIQVSNQLTKFSSNGFHICSTLF